MKLCAIPISDARGEAARARIFERARTQAQRETFSDFFMLLRPK
jgi:hypothetical protein